ncbi:hypothetical protein [Pseudacidovorax sp. NFM-22]|uniref:deoxynucleotide monophosphate kinase family protein n=1 Tax=Pseudacidovorax sp. NFM-22 TaxID=2744469 RepID=UPI001F39F46B|nr:hypothetical protein [Pseudacidovorax sp. NFM-22]
MRRHIIGLTGYAGTGKDTVADLLVTHAGFRKLAFADALRGEVADAFGVDMELLTNPVTKQEPSASLSLDRAPFDFVNALRCHGFADCAKGRECVATDTTWMRAPRSPRQIMQWWGSEYRRRQNPDYWVHQLRSRLILLMQKQLGTRFVITDVRMDNEAAALRSMGACIWQVARPGRNGELEGGHSSATDGCHFSPAFVVNNLHDVRHLQGVVLAEFISRDLDIDRSRVRVEIAA